MNIWTMTRWKKYIDVDACGHRSGLRMRFDQGVDPEVRRACMEFAKWLRQEYEFPMRVPVYVKAAVRIRAMDGDLVCGTFFRPYSMSVEPYARIATGDYLDLCEERGQDNALAEILLCMAHELTHYFQWLNQLNLTPVGEERQAKRYAHLIVDDYADTNEHF